MRKECLFDMYNSLDVDIEHITESINILKDLKGLNADLFYNFCINNKQSIDNDNFSSFLLLFDAFSYINTDEYKKECYFLIDNFFSDDYILSIDELDEIIQTTKIIIANILPQEFIVGPDEVDNITYNYLKNYFKIFNVIKKVPYDKMYNHSFKEISYIYEELLDNLNYTETDEEEDLITNSLNRVEIFSNIASNLEIYSLSSERYYAILRVAISINDVKNLEKFKKRVLKIISDDNISDDEFMYIVESYSDEVNVNTVNLIKDKLFFSVDDDESLKREESYDKNKDLEKLKKILVKNDKKIIRM